MAPQDSLTPMVKRSIRTIQSELEFLADADYLTPQQLQTILNILPSNTNVRSPQTNQAPVQAMSNLNVSSPDPEKHGYYQPSPSPVPSVQSPPSANSYQSQPPPAYPKVAAQPPSALTYASALYAYTPTDPYDLELAAGDRIAVTEYTNAEWWKGRSERTGKEGIFPRNYVKIEEKLPSSASKETEYGNVPMQVSNGPGPGAVEPAGPQDPSKAQQYGKKFGKKLGNAAIFGAGATIGSNIVNGIF